MKSLFERTKMLWGTTSSVPWFFAGIGFYRAWIEVCYAKPLQNFGFQNVAPYDVHFLATSLSLLLCALMARKLVAIYTKNWFIGLSVGLMLLGTLLQIVCFTNSNAPQALAFTAALCCSVGVAGIILLWYELYGCFNIYRTALYYSSSLILAVVVVFILRGFSDTYFYGCLFGLPLLSAWCVVRGFKEVPAQKKPSAVYRKFSFPWKLLALAILYSFSFGLYQPSVYAVTGPHSSGAILIPALLVFAAAICNTKRFNIATMYKIALPLILLIMLFFPVLFQETVAGFSVLIGYETFMIFLMLVISNLAFRFGVSAVWLAGILRGTIGLFILLGRRAGMAIEVMAPGVVQEILPIAVIFISVAACIYLFLSEINFISDWGVSFINDGAEPSQQKNSFLNSHCVILAKQYNLSARESEILEHLAQEETIPQIAEALFVAPGTVRAHIQHIYKKMGIHNRSEIIAGIESAKSDMEK